jgi:pyridoxine kinase
VLHQEFKVPHVVISSIPLNDGLVATFPEWLRTQISTSGITSESTSVEKSLLCITSSALEGDPKFSSVVHALHIPCIPGYFSGVGDLFSALVLAHFHRSPSVEDSSQTALSYAVGKACQTTHALLWRTHRYSMTLPPEDRTVTDVELDTKDIERKVRRMKGRELRLVKEQALILGKDLNTDGKAVSQMKEWKEFWA